MSETPSPETIALAGNPNVGKTTIFNALTKSARAVGNYSGVTVSIAAGTFFTPHGRQLRVLDLPGCYALDGASPDQEIARQVLRGEHPREPRPDLVVCVLDASNLERHLVLTLQIIDLGLPVVVALNMVDVAEKSGLRIDLGRLSEELNVPVIPIQANVGKGLIELRQALRHPFPAAVATTRANSQNHQAAADPAANRARALEICAVAARRPDSPTASGSDSVDRFLLHPVFGWVALLVIMLGVFWTIFSFAKLPMDAIEAFQGFLAGKVTAAMAEGDLRALIVDGVIGGVGGVLVFLPQILLLFFMIGLLEASGYMARATYLMDGIMSKAGLSGKSFLPLFSSYACAIPGVMAARTIDSAKERLVTIFVAPWMSCSARLPVYLVLVPLLLGGRLSALNQALIFLGLYALGTVSALVVARLLRSRLGPDPSPAHFILELPPYRWPQWGYVFRNLWDRGSAFLRKAATLILALSILLWAADTYPKSDSDDPADQLAHSMTGRIGTAIEPIVKPLGFDGRTGTAILTSFAAREVFVSSMSQLYRVEEADNDEETWRRLRGVLATTRWPDGRLMFSVPAVLALLVFFIYALQCLPTSAVVARELKSYKWAIGQFVFMAGFAWIAAFLTFQIASRF